jgi:hypothetical protein
MSSRRRDEIAVKETRGHKRCEIAKNAGIEMIPAFAFNQRVWEHGIIYHAPTACLYKGIG